MKRGLVSFLVFAGLACSEAPSLPPPPIPTDAGMPSDRDEDGVADADDNCPDQENTAQRDFDQDGLGDVCDACLGTPVNGPLTCLQTLPEQEPNDDTPTSLSIPDLDSVIEVASVLEVATTSTGGVDRFELPVVPLEIELPVLLAVRVIALEPNSDFEPKVRIRTPFNVAALREVEGRQRVEREILTLGSGRLIEIRDRRTTRTAPVPYLLQLERRRIPDPIQVPTLRIGESAVINTEITQDGRISFFEVPFEVFDLQSSIPLYAKYETQTSLGQGTSSSGIDTILTARSGGENDNWLSSTTDSRLTVPARGGVPELLAVDFARIVGDEADRQIQLTISYSHSPEEPEPNDTPETANEFPYQGNVYTQFYEKSPPVIEDIDWWWFWGSPGDWTCIKTPGPLNKALGIRAQFTLGYYDAEAWQPLKQIQPAEQGTDGVSLCLILPLETQYFLRVREASGLQISPRMVPAEQSRLWVTADRDEFRSWPLVWRRQLSEDFDRKTVDHNDLTRAVLYVSKQARFDFVTLRHWADYEPRIRIYEHGVGYIAEDLQAVTATLTPSTTPYIVHIDNALPEREVGSGEDFPKAEVEITRTLLE